MRRILPGSRVAAWLAGALLVFACLAADASRPPGAQVSPRVAISLIHGYQHWIHPVSSRYVRCRLQPTCSRFAIDALRAHGLRGALLIGPRLLQCERAAHTSRVVLAANPARPVSLLLLQSNPENVAGCFGCAAVSGFGLIFGLAILATWIALLVWVFRDAKSRAAENPILWMLLVFFLHAVGLILYLLMRPQGNVVPCTSCKGKKLQYARVCPHCGVPDPSVPADAPVPAASFPPRAPASAAFCVSCGAPLMPGVRFCEKCGAATS